MLNVLQRVAIILMFCSLLACQFIPTRGSLLDNGFTLVPANVFEDEVMVWQKVELLTPKGAYFYEFLLDLSSSERIQLVIFSPLGQRVATIVCKNQQISFEKLVPIDLPISPTELMMVMQLIYWPLDVLRQSNDQRRLNFVEKTNKRYIYKNKLEVATVIYKGMNGWNGSIHYASEHGEKLFIESVQI